MKKRNMYLNDDQKEIVNFVIILSVIIVLVLIVYGVSYLVSKKNTYHYDEVTPGEINYDIASVGTMLNRPEEEYYVVIYDDADLNAATYEALVSTYSASSPEALKVYRVDLANKLNESFRAQDGKSNPKAKKVSELALGDFTLIKVAKGEITKYIEDLAQAKKELK